MAELVYAFGSAHAPLLTLPPEKWTRAKTADMMEIPMLDFRGARYTFEELVEVRKNEGFEQEHTQEVRQAKFDRLQLAISELEKRIEAVNPDVLIIVGDDHYEMFKKDIQPMFSTFYTDSLTNFGTDEEDAEFLPDGVSTIMSGQHPVNEDHVYPIEKGLAKSIIDQAKTDGFDITACQEQPSDANGVRNTGHCIGFIYRRLLKDKAIPLVPILINTYFPPNQPTAKRCFEFGKMLGRAIENWGEDKRVAVCASGGLSHFAIDAEWDNAIIDAMKSKNIDRLINEDEVIYAAGTSEVKNWITVLGAVNHKNFEMDMIDYVPCYRTLAGTGTGAGFADWGPRS